MPNVVRNLMKSDLDLQRRPFSPSLLYIYIYIYTGVIIDVYTLLLPYYLSYIYTHLLSSSPSYLLYF